MSADNDIRGDSYRMIYRYCDNCKNAKVPECQLLIYISKKTGTIINMFDYCSEACKEALKEEYGEAQITI
jgi:hypothetical protein